MTDYKMYVYYTIASGIVKRKISPIYKRENTMLFVFKKPEEVMQNIRRVSRFLENKVLFAKKKFLIYLLPKLWEY